MITAIVTGIIGILGTVAGAAVSHYLRFFGELQVVVIYQDVRIMERTSDGMGGYPERKVTNLEEANFITIDCDLSFSNSRDVVEFLQKTEIVFCKDNKEILTKPLWDRNNKHRFAEQLVYEPIKVVNVEPRQTKLVEIHNEWLDLKGEQEAPDTIKLTYWHKKQKYCKTLYTHRNE